MNPIKPSVSNNIFSEIPEQLPEEIVECLLKKENIVIERIISNGHVTSTGQWYDQTEDEWVILLQGQQRIPAIEMLFNVCRLNSITQ